MFARSFLAMAALGLIATTAVPVTASAATSATPTYVRGYYYPAPPPGPPGWGYRPYPGWGYHRPAPPPPPRWGYHRPAPPPYWRQRPPPRWGYPPAPPPPRFRRPIELWPNY